MDFSDYENKIKELEKEIASLRLVIQIKDSDIEKLKCQINEKQLCCASADQQVSHEPTWSQVVSKKKHEERRGSKSDEDRPIIVTTNRFQALQESTSIQESVRGQHNLQNVQATSKQPNPKRKPKVLLLADSNGRYCGDLLEEGLGSNVEVCSIF